VSTSYYHLAEPVTGLRFADNVVGPDALLLVEIDGKLAGQLVVRPGLVPAVLRLFTDRCDDGECPVRSVSGGLREQVRGLDPALQLVSENGDLLTVAELRAGKR